MQKQTKTEPEAEKLRKLTDIVSKNQKGDLLLRRL